MLFGRGRAYSDENGSQGKRSTPDGRVHSRYGESPCDNLYTVCPAIMLFSPGPSSFVIRFRVNQGQARCQKQSGSLLEPIRAPHKLDGE